MLIIYALPLLLLSSETQNPAPKAIVADDIQVIEVDDSPESPPQKPNNPPSDSKPSATKPAAPRSVKRLVLPQIDIIGSRAQLKNIPGSAALIDAQTLTLSHVFTTHEALRKVPGLHVTEEEGLGLRPNIGMRGLDPVRSRKVLLLEDGIPLAYAPYGDNASYYHPPIDRMERIEVLKGSGQILFGPSTIGGVINYITPIPPLKPGGFLQLSGGNRHSVNLHARAGGQWGSNGVVADYVFKQGDGARQNLFSRIHDATFKGVFALGDKQALTVRASFYREDSRLTYSGLTWAEYQENPRANPFKNDALASTRFGSSLTHEYSPLSNLTLTTNLYGMIFDRDWWRQSSLSTQRPNRLGLQANCTGMQDLNTTCGNEGRLRQYYTFGIEPRLRWRYAFHGWKHQLDAGVRGHFEFQKRHLMVGASPEARSGTLTEDNRRTNQAVAAFVQNRFQLGPVNITPGLRVEHVQMQRKNYLLAGGAGIGGQTQLTAFIPGLGITYDPIEQVTLFAGVHRGFAPPRTEDILNDSTGQSLELSPEYSVNYELGTRSTPFRGISGELTLFVMDFQNQIVPASIAGGQGSEVTNGGKTLHAGGEFFTRVDSGLIARIPHNVYVTLAYTYVPLASYRGTRLSQIKGFEQVSVSGNRLPYAPEHTLTTTLGYAHTQYGLDVHLELVHIGAMYSDDLNTIPSSENGQRGRLPAYTLVNAAATYTLPKVPLTAFFTVKNLFNRLYITDRTRGITPGMPLWLQAGLRYTF